MTDKIFFDTNILIYLFDKTDAHKHKVAKNLIKGLIPDSFAYISAQVINEFINATTKKIQYPISFERQKEILSFLDEMFIISPISFYTSFRAIDIKLKYNFSFWDSLIIASALEKKCTILFSEDMQHKQKIENKLEIMNPFA